MAAIQKFEQIEAWQKARELTILIYKLSAASPFSKDFALRDQIRRAAISVMSNIAEGFERGGNKEFVQFLSIAKGSLGELRSQLCLALDQLYLDRISFEQADSLATQTGKLIGGFMIYLRQSKNRGAKFR